MSMFDEMKELTKKLVAVPSMNGTSGERDIADTIEAYLREIPYFKAHPELVITQDLKDDPLHRRNVMALLKGGDGTERDTIMLHGRIDTVDVDDFGKYNSPLTATSWWKRSVKLSCRRTHAVTLKTATICSAEAPAT